MHVSLYKGINALESALMHTDESAAVGLLLVGDLKASSEGFEPPELPVNLSGPVMSLIFIMMRYGTLCGVFVLMLSAGCWFVTFLF